MSIEDFRLKIVTELDKFSSKAAEDALSIRAQSFPSTDLYAMAQIELLTTARVNDAAAKLVNQIFLKMTRPEQPVESSELQQPKTDRIYG